MEFGGESGPTWEGDCAADVRRPENLNASGTAAQPESYKRIWPGPGSEARPPNRKSRKHSKVA
jgi:hypothetical protein